MTINFASRDSVLRITTFLLILGAAMKGNAQVADADLGAAESAADAAQAVTIQQVAKSSKDWNSASQSGRLHRSLKEPLTSFGAAVLGDYLYVFSGHAGAAHGFGKDVLSKHFRRIRFDDPQANWEDLPMHAPAQSVALVTDGQHLYRIGGLSFLNELANEETIYDSTSHFARFDVSARVWTELTPLPEPRSSLDAAVLDRKIYVAGGWNLQGSNSADAPWADDMLRFDLDHPENGWECLPGPGYRSRAISLAAHDGKIYFFGGIQESGITRKVSVYDPRTNNWEAAPDLPADSSTAGFATSSFATGDNLYVTGGSGVIYRLGEQAQNWEIASRLFHPRMFLRLVPADEHRLLAVGGTGTNAADRMTVVESVNVDPQIEQPLKLAKWSIDFGGRAKHSQALTLVGTTLYALGGNASRQPHDFSEDAFLDEAFAFDVGDRSVEVLPAMPVRLQSAASVINRQTSQHHTIAVIGGLGFDSRMTSLDGVYLFDPEAKAWTTVDRKCPEPRAMFETIANSDGIWSFGGAGGSGSALLTNVLHWWGDDSEITPLPEVSLPTPRRSFAAVQLAREVYLIGGLGEGNRVVSQVAVFDFDDRTWRTANSPNYSRVFPSAAVSGGKIYLYGGFSSDSGHFAPATALEVYDPATDRWEMVAKELAEVPSSMRMLAYSDRLLFFGIDKEQDGRANFVLFDPAPKSVPADVAPVQFGTSRGARDHSEETARLLIRRDKNKDGKLSEQELGSRLTHLLVGDRDGDALLSMSELKRQLRMTTELEVGPTQQ